MGGVVGGLVGCAEIKMTGIIKRENGGLVCGRLSLWWVLVLVVQLFWSKETEATFLPPLTSFAF